MKITSKGQVTIPKEIRDYLGVRPHGEVDFKIFDGQVHLVKLEPANKASKFSKLRGTLKSPQSTDEWMLQTRGQE